MTLTAANAPTEEKREQGKTQFRETLRKTCDTIPRNGIIILLGQYNAKIGK
jgi:hypothetical protein